MHDYCTGIMREMLWGEPQVTIKLYQLQKEKQNREKAHEVTSRLSIEESKPNLSIKNYASKPQFFNPSSDIRRSQ